ncbi:hypothetical protein QC762_507015 [Podospora pseudocomata]|uniref:F-box domain-containing protein n=1 Tax=Podospora pseudocomata TaxID=2093779 RepID=A0ABR0GCB0_9PEZI|nr:hypothetical protein QC762_507015 [Podospora pseudocomata]
MARLQDLPVELLTKIVEDFCWCQSPPPHADCHCLTIRCEAHLGREETGLEADYETLAALCLTSRLFNDLATKHLYHYIPDLDSDAQWWLLLRTLVTRRDLGQHVRSLDIVTRDYKTTPDYPEVERYLQDQVKALQAQRVEAGGKLSPWEEREFSTGASNYLISLLTSLCPNVESIRARLTGDSFDFCGAQTMSMLKKVAFEWYDTEGGICLAGLRNLLQAAPSIESMIISPFSQEDDDKLELTLNKLTYLELRHSMVGAGALDSIYKLCPNLEIFKYETGDACIGYEQFAPQDLQRATLNHAQKLRMLMMKEGPGRWEELYDDHLHPGVYEDALVELDAALKARGIECRITPLEDESV